MCLSKDYAVLANCQMKCKISSYNIITSNNFQALHQIRNSKLLASEPRALCKLISQRSIVDSARGCAFECLTQQFPLLLKESKHLIAIKTTCLMHFSHFHIFTFIHSAYCCCCCCCWVGSVVWIDWAGGVGWQQQCCGVCRGGWQIQYSRLLFFFYKYFARYAFGQFTLARVWYGFHLHSTDANTFQGIIIIAWAHSDRLRCIAKQIMASNWLGVRAALAVARARARTTATSTETAACEWLHKYSLLLLLCKHFVRRLNDVLHGRF